MLGHTFYHQHHKYHLKDQFEEAKPVNMIKEKRKPRRK